MKTARYQITHETHYRYAAPVSLSQQLLHLQAREMPYQACLQQQLNIQPEASDSQALQDSFGNPYTLIITQKNPVTGKNANMVMTSTGNQGPLADAPWPEYLVFPGAKITIRGNPSCTSTVQSINAAQQITFSGKCNCPNNNGNNCYF